MPRPIVHANATKQSAGYRLATVCKVLCSQTVSNRWKNFKSRPSFMIVHVRMFATCPHVTHQSILKATSYYSAPVGVTEYCDDCVCVPVCLSFAECMCGTALLIFRKFLCIIITYGRDSVLLWQRCKILCTSGFMGDTIFANSELCGECGYRCSEWRHSVVVRRLTPLLSAAPYWLCRRLLYSRPLWKGGRGRSMQWTTALLPSGDIPEKHVKTINKMLKSVFSIQYLTRSRLKLPREIDTTASIEWRKLMTPMRPTELIIHSNSIPNSHQTTEPTPLATTGLGRSERISSEV